jgi:hypothetical protein
MSEEKVDGPMDGEEVPAEVSRVEIQIVTCTACIAVIVVWNTVPKGEWTCSY